MEVWRLHNEGIEGLREFVLSYSILECRRDAEFPIWLSHNCPIRGEELETVEAMGIRIIYVGVIGMYKKRGICIYEQGDYVLYQDSVYRVREPIWMKGRWYPNIYIILDLSYPHVWEYADPKELKIAPAWRVSLELLGE